MATIMDARLEQLKRLPLRPRETWQGGLVPMRSFVDNEAGEPFRPVMALWVAVRAEKVHCGGLSRPEEQNLAAAVEALFAFAFESDFGGYRPARIEVSDTALAEHLSGLLADTGIDVRHVNSLDCVEQVLDSMEAAMPEPVDSLPGPLDGDGVTIDRLRAFAESAATFYQAAPWQHLTDIDLLRIEAPRAQRGMEFCTVLGAGGRMFGLTFYRTEDELFDINRASCDGNRKLLEQMKVWQMSFNPLHELPSRDAELWGKLNLPVAGPTAYPLMLRFCGQDPPARAGERELRFAELVLTALAETTEAEIDAGRWQKTVATSDGPASITLAIPDLLKPPTREKWLQRGFAPDRRANEQMFADMDRFFRDQPPSSVEEMNAVLASRFAGRKVTDHVTQPGTPLEQAQDLCYQAFDHYGRRRVQLARQALLICGDCADAYVILAEQAGTRESELDYYAQAMAAGERALGQATFQESIGHFWGVTSTRPYMRARLGLAQTLEQVDRAADAVEHYEELLRLNPNDNQGVRYLLLPRLLQLGRDEPAARLLKSFQDESANWAYSRALLAFRLSGRSPAAQRELHGALKTNPHLPQFLTDDPGWPLPDHYSPGTEEEALLAAEELRPAFQATPGAVEWVVAESGKWQASQEKKRREQRRKQREKDQKQTRR